MIWQAAKADAVGGRKEQQDRVELFEARDGSERLLVLADGMGGHSGGALAAETVIDTARSAWRKHLSEPQPAEALLCAVIEQAHGRINAAGEAKGLSPRSTAVLLHITDQRAHWAHVGDSRIYRFRGSELIGRSHDHSVVQMLVDMGKVGEDEMATHPDQNRLTQSLGGDKAPEPDLDSAEIAIGDGFVLCSDGLWERITPEEMVEVLQADALSVEAKKLVKLAAKRGGAEGDNVTIAMARADDVGEGKRVGGRLRDLFSAYFLVATVAGLLVLHAQPNPAGMMAEGAEVSLALLRPADRLAAQGARPHREPGRYRAR
jgi:serine/threonine protein phosphatase PrpC